MNLKGITVRSFNTLFKSLTLTALFGAAALLAGCGGGGAADPFKPGPVTPALVVNPTALTVYSGTPAVVTISSGVGPFQAFTSDAVVLPVTQSISGAALTLVANAVESDKAVTVTIQDAVGQRVATSVTVRGSPLLGALTVAAVTGSTCGGAASGGGASGGAASTSAALCSGESGTAKIKLRTANTSPASNRQVRFDVLQGAYDFIADQAGTTLVKTITAITDQNGDATVTLRTSASVPTQAALIRATDLTSGNRVDGSFTIVQSTNGAASLSVSPKEYGITGFYVQSCSTGSADFVIYGGSPPYTVFHALPARATLSSGAATGQTVVVAASGGSFRMTAIGGACAGTTEDNITITDSTGRVINANFKIVEGTVALPVPDPVVPPGALTVTPGSIAVSGTGGACAPGSVTFVISGGTPAYAVASSRTEVTASRPASNAGVLSWTSPLPNGFSAALVVLDAAGKVANATFTCTATP